VFFLQRICDIKELGMIYFIYGEDSYRAKEKLGEIIDGYKKVHKSGLNLIYVDAKEKSFDDFYSNFKVSSMFAEKKLIILKNVFEDKKFQEDFLGSIKNLQDLKDIVVIFQEQTPDKRTKIFKALQKDAKCQEFEKLEYPALKKWVMQELEKTNTKIAPDALELLLNFVKSDLWRMANEIKKISDYKKDSGLVKKEDIELLIRPDVESDIFKTIDALAAKDKKLALSLLHKHLENGDSPLYLLSMIIYQFRNLLIIKELQDAGKPYGTIIKTSGLHPFVAQKTCTLCGHFSMDKLKKIYQKIFQIDADIKVGKIEPELSLDLLIAEI